MVNQPINNRHKDFKENPMSQEQQPLQSHRTNATEPESSSDQEDTNVAANKENNEEEAEETHLMLNWKKSGDQRVDCYKQPVATDNENAPRKMSSNAGKVDENERESGKFSKEGKLAAGEMDQRAKAQVCKEDKEGVDDGPELNQIKPNRKS